MPSTETRPDFPTGRVTPSALRVSRPTDGSTLAEVPIDEPEQVARKAAELRDAQPEWEALGVHERTRHLERMRDWLLDNGERIAGILHEEAGKVGPESLLELNWVADIINTYARTAPRLLADRNVRPRSPLLKAKRFQVVRRPFPLVGVIGPWNFPVVLSFGDALPALLAGAAVMIKPSEVTPLALREVVRGWREDVGAPPVLQAVFGAGATGEALIDAVDYVQFTGSVATGRRVAERAARTITPVSLELGGKDPFIVLKDANLTRAANCAVVGGLVNNGQVCVSSERIYVEAPIYAEFLKKVVDNVRELRMGIDTPGDPKELGPMISPAQLQIVDAHVQDAEQKGARILIGGKRAQTPGDWYEPTVLADVDHSMTIMREETFGPVLPIMKVADEAEAVRLANDSEFGLSATVFVGDAGHGVDVARRIDAGSVNVNDYGTTTMCIDVPMGGWKRSGIGARSGDYGLLKYTRAKAISSPRLPSADTELWWFPYTPLKQGLIRRAFRFVNARGLRARLGGSAQSPRR